MGIIYRMRTIATFLTAGLFGLLLALPASPPAVVHAQAPAAGQSPTSAQPTFRVSVDLVTTDVIVRDQKSDQFVADIKADEFEVYEDGVKQQIASLVLTHGGRVYNVQAPPPAARKPRAAVMPPGMGCTVTRPAPRSRSPVAWRSAASAARRARGRPRAVRTSGTTGSRCNPKTPSRGPRGAGRSRIRAG